MQNRANCPILPENTPTLTIPQRFRVTRTLDTAEKPIMEEPAAKSRRHRPSRTAAQREKERERERRRESNRGPFRCPFCDRELLHRSGYRRHIITAHRKNCSWSGVVSDFVNEEHMARALVAVHRSGRHDQNSARRVSQSHATSNTRASPDTVISASVSLASTRGHDHRTIATENNLMISPESITVTEYSRSPVARFRRMTYKPLDLETESVERPVGGSSSPCASLLQEFEETSDQFDLDAYVDSLTQFDIGAVALVPPVPHLATADAATCTMSTVDVEMQTNWPYLQTRGTQTPMADLYLPPGVTAESLLQVVTTNLQDSARVIALRMSTTQPFPFTSTQASLLEAIVYLMTETQRHGTTTKNTASPYQGG
jgi:hypothetical protein